MDRTQSYKDATGTMSESSSTQKHLVVVLSLTTIGLLISTIILASENSQSVDLHLQQNDDDHPASAAEASVVSAEMQATLSSVAEMQQTLTAFTAMTDRVAPLSAKPPSGSNPCAGTQPASGFENKECFEDSVEEQAGANVTKGYQGLFETDAVPITTPYFQAGLCPVNVHWHLGAEHYSAGQFDEDGSGPSHTEEHKDGHRKAREGAVRQGFQCHKYDATDEKFTKPFDWKHCDSHMEVGQTYEVHWPHSKGGACGTINQYQTPFYDGVFCKSSQLAPTTYEAIGVQSQTFVIVNDEHYYYPDLMRGMIVDGDYGSDIAMYTGSTTGTSRDNKICSSYTPISWHVDRTCQLISASTFDKMCADMKAQRDDMSDDLHAHGSRKLVADELAANNLVDGTYFYRY